MQIVFFIVFFHIYILITKISYNSSFFNFGNTEQPILDQIMKHFITLKGFVRMSLTFSSLFTYPNLISLAAIASQERWYAMALCFFLRTLEGTEAFKTTDMLSPNIRVGPSKSTSNDLNMNLTSKTSSVAILDATNSEP
jgi:hypothetical protein